MSKESFDSICWDHGIITCIALQASLGIESDKQITQMIIGDVDNKNNKPYLQILRLCIVA